MSPAFTFIHTSDWHLGLSLYGRDCRMRQEAMLARLAEVVADRRPDAVIVSGDIYDSAQPPVWATRLLVEGLAAVRRADPAEGASSADDSMTVAEFRDTPPFDLAARYAADTAADFSPELMELFREIESSIE